MKKAEKSAETHAIKPRRQNKNLLREQKIIVELSQEINAVLISEGDLSKILNRCAGVFVRSLDAALVRVWTFNEREEILELKASAGIHLPSDEKYSRIRLGERKVGTIAKERAAHLVNDILSDPLFTDKSWIKREKLTAFAGYPLIVEDRLVGVMCVFAREPLTKLTIDAMASVANAVASFIERKKTEESRRELVERLDEARENERRYLSRQLHDDVSQQLAAASIKLHRLEKKLINLLPDDHSVISDIVVAQELLHRNQKSLRQIAHILHPGILEKFGLPDALRKFTSDVEAFSAESSPIVVSLKIPNDFPRLSLPVETALYRIAQESVINAVKHAFARKISLKIAAKKNSCFLSVKDDGCGFDEEKIGENGIGLSSMKERAAAVDAALFVISREGAGTEIILTIPLNKTTNAR